MRIAAILVWPCAMGFKGGRGGCIKKFTLLVAVTNLAIYIVIFTEKAHIFQAVL